MLEFSKDFNLGTNKVFFVQYTAFDAEFSSYYER